LFYASKPLSDICLTVMRHGISRRFLHQTYP